MCSAKSLGNNTLSCNVGSMCFPQNGLELLESIEEVQVNWDPRDIGISFLAPPLLCKNLSHVRIDQCKEDVNSERNIDATSWNLTAPSCSRSTVSSCRSNLIINFDTSKQLLSNLPGFFRLSISAHDSALGSS